MSNPHVANQTKAKRPTKKPHTFQGGSSEANRLAVVILEVLAGGRSPNDAAKALGVVAPRYYQLETRALEGLIAALEPRPKVRQPSPQGRIAQLEKALGEARRECLRQQALVRAAQRSLGIKAPETESKPSGKDAAARKKRRPAVRALKVARGLAQVTRPPEEETVQQGDQSVCPAVLAPDGYGASPAGLSTTPEGTLR